MGVMACDKNGCENVMCDRYSTEHGYICNECLDQLTDLGVEADIDVFMNTPKKNIVYGMEEIARKRFELEFPPTWTD